MKDKLTIQQFVEEIARQSGISKKMVDELGKALPEVISEGLEKDGLVRISGLGTFKLKYVKERVGHNFRTGRNINIPGHNKLVFHPEKQMQEKVNQDFRYLTYKVIKDEAEEIREESVSESKTVETYSPAFDSREASPVMEELAMEGAVPPSYDTYSESESSGSGEEFTPRQNEPPLPPPKRNKYFWVIPTVFLFIILLLVVFYFRTCRQEPVFEKTPTNSDTEQIIKAKGPISGSSDSIASDTSSIQKPEEKVPEKQEVKPVRPVEEQAAARQGKEEKYYTVPEGQRLYQIARQEYGDPKLWVLIYKANKDKIPDPDNLYKGTQLIIPALEGSPQHLSSNDSLEISRAYKMLYDYYSEKKDPRADNYLKVSRDFGAE